MNKKPDPKETRALKKKIEELEETVRRQEEELDKLRPYKNRADHEFEKRIRCVKVNYENV